MCRLVKVGSAAAQIGWEMQCRHPEHNHTDLPNCRKNLRLTAHGRTPELTKRMLQVWAAWGATALSQDSHKELWDTVVEAARKGTLPTDVQPPMVFTMGPGGPVMEPSRKRARIME